MIQPLPDFNCTALTIVIICGRAYLTFPPVLFFVFFNEVDFGEWKFHLQNEQLDLSVTPLFLQDDGSYLYIPDREDYEKISLDISSFIIHLVQSIPSLPVVIITPFPLSLGTESDYPLASEKAFFLFIDPLQRNPRVPSGYNSVSFLLEGRLGGDQLSFVFFEFGIYFYL